MVMYEGIKQKMAMDNDIKQKMPNYFDSITVAELLKSPTKSFVRNVEDENASLKKDIEGVKIWKSIENDSSGLVGIDSGKAFLDLALRIMEMKRILILRLFLMILNMRI
uniref:SERPIN domain-containing protein n=1 Tax=Rhabditophanes sp. KR3021 TaxID=114890 RepID=A0AC35TGD3_9BILA